MNNWISVKDKFPLGQQDFLAYIIKEKGEDILRIPFPYIDLAFLINDKGECKFFVSEFGSEIEVEITHWMPLPEPPKDQ